MEERLRRFPGARRRLAEELLTGHLDDDVVGPDDTGRAGRLDQDVGCDGDRLRPVGQCHRPVQSRDHGPFVRILEAV